MAFFYIQKKVHWSDSDAAGIVWFPNFFGWFEAAEEELFAALGRPRHALLMELGFGMPRVEAHIHFHSPARPGDLIRIGLDSRVENPRRIRHRFEIRHDQTLLAEGFVRVACIDTATFTPRDLPGEVISLLASLPDAAERQARGAVDIPWT